MTDNGRPSKDAVLVRLDDDEYFVEPNSVKPRGDDFLMCLAWKVYSVSPVFNWTIQNRLAKKFTSTPTDNERIQAIRDGAKILLGSIGKGSQGVGQDIEFLFSKFDAANKTIVELREERDDYKAILEEINDGSRSPQYIASCILGRWRHRQASTVSKQGVTSAAEPASEQTNK